MVIVLWFFRSCLDGKSRQIDLVSLLHSHYEFEEKEEEDSRSARNVTRQFEARHVTGSVVAGTVAPVIRF